MLSMWMAVERLKHMHKASKIAKATPASCNNEQYYCRTWQQSIKTCSTWALDCIWTWRAALSAIYRRASVAIFTTLRVFKKCRYFCVLYWWLTQHVFHWVHPCVCVSVCVRAHCGGTSLCQYREHKRIVNTSWPYRDRNNMPLCK